MMSVVASVEADDLGRSLELSRRLVGAARAVAAQLGLPDLATVELPPIGSSAVDRAGLQAAAALYLASELETARLVPAMEVLAGIFATGALPVDIGPAAPLLLGVWRHRNQRFARPEREAFFARMFGRSGGPGLASSSATGSNEQFDALMIDLAEAMYRVGQASPYDGRDRRSQVAVEMAAQNLAANLSQRSHGMTVYASGDIVNAIREAVTIFSHPQVQAAVGASSMWGAVRNATRNYLNEDVDLDAHVRRGQSGQVILAWLADVAGSGGTDGTYVRQDDAVVAAAATWLQISLALAERQPAATGR